jgi:triosephosphate isomerase (TIM)
MRNKIIAANWKMNKTLEEGIALAVELKEKLKESDNKTAVICPPYIHLAALADLFKGQNHIKTGAQNCHWELSGAFTGEISVSMLVSTGATYVIIGHSERRQYFSETDEIVARKIDLALQNNLNLIFCCGEPLDQRESNNHFEWVENQLKNGLFHLNRRNMSRVVIAYEPIWAIGTGKVASPVQAGEMHAFIRQQIENHYDRNVADNISILYGGSVKPGNAVSLFSQPDVDGGLIGGASLNAADFLAIYSAV